MRQETFYTPEKVAELRQCVKQTIYRHLNDPSQSFFPNARVMGKRGWLIPEQDVINYLGFDPNEVSITIVDTKDHAS